MKQVASTGEHGEVAIQVVEVECLRDALGYFELTGNYEGIRRYRRKWLGRHSNRQRKACSCD
jgi:hypothetical protein